MPQLDRLELPVEKVRRKPQLWYRGLQFGGATIQSRAADHNTYALNYLAFARSGWEDRVNYKKLLDDFLLGMFGPAAADIRPIYKRFQAKLARAEREGAIPPFLTPYPPAIGCFLPNSLNIAYLLDEGSDFMFACIDRALNKIRDERRQLQQFRQAADYWALAADIVRTCKQIETRLQQGDPQAAAGAGLGNTGTGAGPACAGTGAF